MSDPQLRVQLHRLRQSVQTARKSLLAVRALLAHDSYVSLIEADPLSHSKIVAQALMAIAKARR